MSMNCEFILSWNATPDQLSALGAALWRWSDHTRGNTSIYGYLDNQPLADLIAGKFPTASQTPWQSERGHIHLRMRDEVSKDREAAVARLRREIPGKLVEDIVVEGASWSA